MGRRIPPPEDDDVAASAGPPDSFYKEIRCHPPKSSRYDPIEKLVEELRSTGRQSRIRLDDGGQRVVIREGVEAAAAIRRLLRGGPEVVARVTDDARLGEKVRTGNPDGRPPKDRPTSAELWAECLAEQAKVHRVMSPMEAARIVALRHELNAAHIMKLTRPHRRTD